ncbi:MAG TPA: lysine--tRNA ligase [Pyrinomonadaceae bacterium]|nr:lysine--tRNA ligase [Pyrinomonadaceae bacterium]
MHTPRFDEIVEQNDQTNARRDHLDALRQLVGNVYPNKFVRSRITGDEDTITNLLKFEPVTKIVAEIKDVLAKLNPGERPPADVKDQLNARLKEFGTVRIAGRLTTPPRGNFVHLTDGMNKLQVYAKKGTFALIRNDADNSLDEENGWAAWQVLDHGDFIGVEGYLFITNTGEISVHVEKLQFLAKAMLPMPDKMHGIADAEIRQRRRYADLIGSSLQVEHEGLTTRQVFEVRAKTISSMRNFLESHGYIEVETPMLTPKATGAAAKPFETHHNALDITLYARIAPELYLKRLIVGGFEKVYELNRNFRNEGISYKHNPEFTMLEFYCAYMDVEGMMNFCEELLRQAVQNAVGSLVVDYEGNKIDFSKFERLTMKEAIARVASTVWPDIGFDAAWLDDPIQVAKLITFQFEPFESASERWERVQNYIFTDAGKKYGSNLATLFEITVERSILNPTFIIDFPKAISPLSKASPNNPQIAERFELYIYGMEVANGFSELNDPKEQYDRFIDQVKERERGDEEAMVLDEDYIRALSYGMPPTAGIGIGIDRLVMLLTNKHSIRDVILFPHLRPETKNLNPEDAEGN